MSDVSLGSSLSGCPYNVGMFNNCHNMKVETPSLPASNHAPMSPNKAPHLATPCDSRGLLRPPPVNQHESNGAPGL